MFHCNVILAEVIEYKARGTDQYKHVSTVIQYYESEICRTKIYEVNVVGHATRYIVWESEDLEHKIWIKYENIHLKEIS